MQYLSWASFKIPLGFLAGMSMRKTAKTVENASGFVFARGFEGAEISIQIQVDRAKCAALGLDFNEWYRFLEDLAIETRSEAGAVTLGGYPLYPELLFAATNKNLTRTTDMSTAAPISIACDLVLSGVECAKEVVRQRALEFESEAHAFAKILLKMRDKKLVIQDSTAVSGLIVTPSTCALELCLGSDRTRSKRESFLEALVDEREATVTLELPSGELSYHIVRADLIGGILRIDGSIFSEKAKQVVSKTFEDCDLIEIIQFLCEKLGVDATIRARGAVAYYHLNSAPLEALEALQASAGFVVSSHGGKLNFSFLPDAIEASASLEGLEIEEDSMDEHISGVLWRDGEHEFEAGDKLGEILRVESVFRSGATHWAKECLRRAQYRSRVLVASGALVPEIRHHSQVSIAKENGTVAGLVDYFTFDFIAQRMQVELRY